MLITAGGLASRILGLFREQLAANYFGAGDAVAAFQIADNVQTLVFDLVISGMLQAALVPVLVEFSGIEQRHQLRRISGSIATVAVVTIGLATFLGWMFTDSVVNLMTGLGSHGQARSAETIALTEHMVRIVLPGVLFLALGSVFSAVLYSIGKASGPAMALAARNLAVVVSILVLGERLGVESMAWGALVGGVLVAALQVPWLIRARALPIPNLQLRDAAVRQIGRLYLPVFLGLIVSTVQVVVDRNLAWQAEADALGAMRYATTLVQSVLGLVAAAVSLAALPALARHFTNRDDERFDQTLADAVRLVTLLIVPTVAGLAVLARPVVALLFEHGETGSSEAHSIAIVLLGYLPGTLFAAFDQLLIYAFYARKRTWTPVLVGIASVFAYFAVAGVVADRYGALGLAIANSAQFIVHTVILGWLARALVRRIWRKAADLVQVTVASTIASTVGAYIALVFVRSLGSGFAIELVSVVVPVGVAATTYTILMGRSGLPEVELLARRLSISRSSR